MIILNIKKALTKHHIKQVDIINATGKCKTYVSLIASGRQLPSMDLFLKIVNKLHIPVEDCFEEVEK